MEQKYDHIKAAQEVQTYWDTHKTYAAKNNPRPLFSIDTPPPTVSGSLHIGHIFSYTQTDIIARYKRMSGYSVYYPFGFDDNGLPTERYVEKKLDIAAHSMSRSAFIELCLQETADVEKKFEALWKSIGLSVDWDACYSTISAPVRKISQESFILLYKKGFIYRKQEPALYCTSCRTSVAQAELDDAPKPSFFNDIQFTSDSGQPLIIGTTRPELLPSCVALFYNPDDARYQHLAGQQATVPLYGYKVPILADTTVSIQKGTGLVMCCTFGDKTDIAWYKKYNLPYRPSINQDGRWNEQSGILAGLKAPAARERMLQELSQQGLLIKQAAITHTVNVHERCKKEIELLILSQWFLNLLDYKQEFLALADRVNWHPHFMKARYTNWVENLGWDWCLSRQRFFGIPFPAWHCTACNEVILADIKDLPIDPQETAYAGPCPRCNAATLIADTDVMDTWNTSSLTPQICFSLYNRTAPSAFTGPAINDFMPMAMRPQAHDIIRTWAFDTMVKAWMHTGQIPWKDIVISGHVLSDAKEKLSKSKENSALTPENLLTTYSADAIRYWTASGSLGQDTAFSQTQLAIGQRLVTKLWNGFRFIHEHTKNQATDSSAPDALGVVNEWILHQATTCFAVYQKHLDQYEFNLALDAAEKFFWHDFCDNYLELIKEQLFKPELYTAQTVHATRWTLHQVGLRILQLYAPYVPHITETLYQTIYGHGSVHQTQFKQIQISYSFEQSDRIMNHVISLIGTVRTLKTQKQLSLKTALTRLELYGDTQIFELIKDQQQLIKGITHADTITYQTQPLAAPELVDDQGNWVARVLLA